MPLIVGVRIAKPCELLVSAVDWDGDTDVMVVLIVCDYVYTIVAVFNNVMTLVRVDSSASKDLVPDGLIRYTDSEGPEAVNMEIECRSEQRGISAEIVLTVIQPPFACFSCLGCCSHSIGISIGI